MLFSYVLLKQRELAIDGINFIGISQTCTDHSINFVLPINLTVTKNLNEKKVEKKIISVTQNLYLIKFNGFKDELGYYGSFKRFRCKYISLIT